MKFVHHISGKIPNPNKQININLENRNLLIIGDNGSGKTSLLKLIYDTLQEQIISSGHHMLTGLQTTLSYYKNSPEVDNRERERWIKMSEDDIANHESESILRFKDAQRFEDLTRNKTATIKLFEANRQAEVSSSGLASRFTPKANDINTAGSLSKDLEQHLVNLKVRAALDTYHLNNPNKSSKIESWFEFFTHNLKILFEDDTLELIFNPNELNFLIHQQGKQPYSFQNLSSGFSSILSIYAHLLMHTEYAEITPDELEGVALIDELDAHLHVSLQRKIFPFLTKSFPNIQFIVTTHSPFVLTSVDDALIYDLTENREHNDLSMYSFEAVAEGLLGVPPISKQFEKILTKLTEITNRDAFDIDEAEEILQTIYPRLDVLDPESAMFYQLAKNKILKAKSRDN